jgi:hypothetical protein
MSLSKLVWAMGNKCSTIHIIPEQKFMPALCGFESKANRGRTPKLVILKTDEVEKIMQSKKLIHDGIKICKKCLTLAKKDSSKLEYFKK